MPTPQARRRALRRFAEEFERGAYWDAHEQLETLWRIDRLELWQALIQLAATFVLLTSDRPGGARSVLSRAQGKLAALPEWLHGVDVGWVRRQCGRDAALSSPRSGRVRANPVISVGELPAQVHAK